MTKRLLLLSPFVIVFVLSLAYVGLQASKSIQFNNPSTTEAAGETKKEIGITPPSFVSGSSFTDIASPPNYLSVGSEYWVRLTVNGKENPPAPYAGSDIMLILDVTGSMRDPMEIGPSSPGTNTTRIQAAKQALRSFTADAKPVDNVGFGTFATCIPTNGQYTSTANGVPLIWAYEDSVTSGTRSAYGYLHHQLLKADTQQINSINSLLNDSNTGGSLRFVGRNVIFCQNNTYQGLQTNPGAGLVVGLSQLTELMQNQRRSDNTLFKTSYANPFPGKNYRPDKKRYIVLATDGEENTFPRAFENQSLVQQLGDSTLQNAVAYAARNGVVIYTLSIGNDGNAYADNLRRIAQETGGKYFPGRNRDELINSYDQISNEVTAQATQLNMTVHEVINTTHFSIANLDPSTNAYENNLFISKSTNGSSELNVTNATCPGGSCINKNAESNYDFNLPAIAQNEKYYIYFKVQAINSSTDLVNVDSSESKILYSDNTQTLLANKQVVINQPKPFFQATTGDVYSKGNLQSPLLLNENLVVHNDTIVFHRNDLDLGNGKANPIERKTQYTMLDQEFYQNYETLLKNQIQNRAVANGNIQKAQLGVTNAAEGTAIIKVTSTTRDFTFNESSNFNDNITRVIFVDGNLYIRNGDYTINKNGANSLVFIVSGNLAFDSAITKAEGIFFVDGVVDTACGASAKFISNECSPTTATPSLDIQGALVVGTSGNIKLQREGNPTEDLATRKPGELFTYRPDLVWPLNKILGKVVRSWKEVED